MTTSLLDRLVTSLHSRPRRSLPDRLVASLHSRPRRSLLAALVFVVLAGVFGGPVVGSLQADGGFTASSSDSARAVERIEAATGRSPSPGVVLVVDTPAGSPATAVSTQVAALAAIDGIAAAAPAGRAEDGSSALVVGTLEAEADKRDVATAVIAAFDGSQDVTVGGQAVASTQLGQEVGKDRSRAELLAFPVLALLSILIFGGRAAILPLAVGIATIAGTFLALAGINQVYGLSIFALNLVIGLGLGLAVDYTLFLLSRYREELERQGPTAEALMTTMRTAGRTVVFSAVTVAVALATLIVFPVGFLKSMGIAGAVVAMVSGAMALLITPAVIGLWGGKLARRRRSHGKGKGRWYRFAHAVMRRPGLIALATAAVMAVLAVPALGAVWTPVDGTVVPKHVSARVVTDTLAASYGGAGGSPVTVAVSSSDAGAVSALTQRASDLPGLVGPAQVRDLGSDTWQVDLRATGDPAGETARRLVEDIRAAAADTGTDALVAGPAAEFVDQQSAIAGALPAAAALLVVLTVLVLWLMTGSVVLPLMAVVMNALTVGVALGAITFVYQAGRLTDLLGYTPNGGVEPANFLVAAALVFALSTDYGVFLFGRIREAREAGSADKEAVAQGLGRTGSVVTAAAILLAVAIGAFSTSSISFMQQIGIATAMGVLLDAFVVRSFLVPALMGVMGKWTWWAPMGLRRLHDRIGLAE